MPGDRIEVDLDKQFTKDEFEKIKLGFRSHDMDQRWNILYEDNLLYIHRSWTGHCIFIGTVKGNQDCTGHLSHLTINGDGTQYQRVDTNEDVNTMLMIVGSHLIERVRDK